MTSRRLRLYSLVLAWCLSACLGRARTFSVCLFSGYVSHRFKLSPFISVCVSQLPLVHVGFPFCLSLIRLVHISLCLFLFTSILFGTSQLLDQLNACLLGPCMIFQRSVGVLCWDDFDLKATVLPGCFMDVQA